MSQEDDLVLAISVRTPFEAQTVALVLEQEGIRCVVAGDLLQDEFAAARRMVGVDVQVCRRDLERAHAAIAAAKEAGQAFETGAADPEASS